ncbi:sugar-transfer associated ATP-grasp domain-containing protein [Mangrovibacterium sp.]|uniref:sugar-transfer associated ATP-grasp domain-containing protein n=1 Tax=Mangrovibacterium sp. TaxID=1961364 RepID=UPI003566EC3D
MGKVASLALRMFEFTRDYRYHFLQKQIAKGLLHSIEQERGKTERHLIRLCDGYAIDVFGHPMFAPWLYVYAAVAGEFREGWIPDNYYAKTVVPAIKGGYGEVSFLKPLTGKLFNSDYFPDMGAYVNGIWVSKSNEVLKPEQLSEYFFSQSTRIVFKLDNSLQGKGIHFFTRETFSPAELERLGNGVVQSCIVQHPFFDEIVRGAVATLRITTVILNSGECSLRACHLRIGRKSETHVQSASQLLVTVDPTTGELSSVAFMSNWKTVNCHPDTAFVFGAQKIPFFDECVRVVKKLHLQVPFVRAVGWDVVVDCNNQVKVMEWNGAHNGIKFSEATQGPCFADLGWESLWKKRNEMHPEN